MQEEQETQRRRDEQIRADAEMAKGMEAALLSHFADLDLAHAMQIQERINAEEEAVAERRRQAAQQRTEILTCALCRRTFPFTHPDLFYFYHCSHMACKSCVEQHVRSEVGICPIVTADAIECPIMGCGVLMTVREVNSFLDPTTAAKLAQRQGLKSVFELLYCMLWVAAKSDRWQAILQPFPLRSCPGDIAVLGNTLDALSNADDRATFVMPQPRRCLEATLNRVHAHAIELFGFMCGSAEAYSLVKLNAEERLHFMSTPHQYLIKQHPRNARFAEKKRLYGSKFAYHGSRPENWFAILHGGLKNASGTTLQLNGAAHGKGIYMSPTLAVSNGYSMLTGSRRDQYASDEYVEDALDTATFRCMAIVEVINKNIKISGDIWVQPNEEYVAVRFFVRVPPWMLSRCCPTRHPRERCIP
jgi:hypothetical protein